MTIIKLSLHSSVFLVFLRKVSSLHGNPPSPTLSPGRTLASRQTFKHLGGMPRRWDSGGEPERPLLRRATG